MVDDVVYGLHAVSAALNNRHRKVEQLFISSTRDDKRLRDIFELAENKKVKIVNLSAQAMKHRYNDMIHQGVVAHVGPLIEYSERDLPALLDERPGQKNTLILILDGVTDPHNLGACLRSADAAAVDFVMIPKDNNAPLTPVVSKVACGALESVPVVRVTNLARAMELLKDRGIWIYGAASETHESIYDLNCKISIAIVMGAEGKGMRRLTRERCDGLFAIPMFGAVTSLNVSVATGVCLYEVVRQRMS